ncbi:MAG: AAA family ATPase [Oscillospiraceae bacterium]|nr:AAA family ATPase [Oscillospiraceae bacterium]
MYIDKVLIKSLDETSYIANLPVVKNLTKKKELRLGNPVTFLVGENGTGKSTLLEGIAVCAGFNAEGGSRNFDFFTKSTESNLYKYLTLVKHRYEKDGFFLRAESFYNVASYIDDLDNQPSAEPLISAYGGNSLHHQSHGESFLSLVQNRFSGHGLYILDEPEAALSPLRQMTLLLEIKRLAELDSQFIIATHSPILLAYPNAKIYELTDNDIKLTPYQETEHYKLTKQFIENPDLMIKYLLDEHSTK